MSEVPVGALVYLGLLVLGGAVLLWRIGPRSRGWSWKVQPWPVSIEAFLLMASALLSLVLLLSALPLLFTESGADVPITLTAAANLMVMSLGALALAVFFRWYPGLGDRWSPGIRLSGGRVVAWGLMATVALYPLLLAASLLWSALLSLAESLGLPFSQEPQAAVALVAAADNPLALMLVAAVAVLAAPIGEELFFRGALYPFLKRWMHRWAAVLLSALLFALAHAFVLGLLPLMLVGIALALAYEWSGDLRVAMVLHAAFNASQLGLMLLYPELTGL